MTNPDWEPSSTFSVCINITRLNLFLRQACSPLNTLIEIYNVSFDGSQMKRKQDLRARSEWRVCVCVRMRVTLHHNVNNNPALIFTWWSPKVSPLWLSVIYAIHPEICGRTCGSNATPFSLNQFSFYLFAVSHAFTNRNRRQKSNLIEKHSHSSWTKFVSITFFSIFFLLAFVSVAREDNTNIIWPECNGI